jgi:hypothetical protein
MLGGDAFFMCGQTQLLDRASFVQSRDSGAGTGIQVRRDNLPMKETALA